MHSGQARQGLVQCLLERRQVQASIEVALVGVGPTRVASAGEEAVVKEGRSVEGLRLVVRLEESVLVVVDPAEEGFVEEALVFHQLLEVGRQAASEEVDPVFGRVALVVHQEVLASHREVLVCYQAVVDQAVDHCHQARLVRADLEVPTDQVHPAEVAEVVVAACLHSFQRQFLPQLEVALCQVLEDRLDSQPCLELVLHP